MLYDVIIVGTGAGGATVAHELSKKNLNILVLEKGLNYPMGTAANHINNTKLSLNFKKNPDNNRYEFLNYPAELMNIEELGGTTPVSLANACTSCYKNSATAQFKGFDLELFEELLEASKELKVGSLPAEKMGPAIRMIVDKCEKLGYFMEPMPKFIDLDKCDSCGLCILGCTKGAKWDANDFIKEIKETENTTKILSNFTVELNNLQRQMLFDENDVGTPKAVAAAEKIASINSDIEVHPIIKDVNYTNIEEILNGVDLVIDGTDNIQTRMLINDVCVKNRIPWIYTGAIGTSGMSMNILPDKACIRCLYPGIPKAGSLPTCDTMGVLNTITVIMGSIETTEAIKILLGYYDDIESINSNLLVYDTWNQSFDSIIVKKNEKCECCGKENYEFIDSDEQEIITSLCGRNAIQITPADPKELSLKGIGEKLEKLVTIKCSDFIMLFKNDETEISLFRDGRAIIKGTNDEIVARTIYARYIGT